MIGTAVVEVMPTSRAMSASGVSSKVSHVRGAPVWYIRSIGVPALNGTWRPTGAGQLQVATTTAPSSS